MNMNYGLDQQRVGPGLTTNFPLKPEQEPGIQQVAGELAPRVGQINQRLDRISAALRCLPQNPESGKCSIAGVGDVTASLAQAHGALSYAESTLSDIERAIGI